MTEEVKNSPIADFDWDAYEKGESKSEKSREELTKTYDESLNTVKDKDVIEGTIIALNKREAVVNIGYKSDGIIPMNEFRYNPDIKIGDVVEVFIENQEDKKGQLILSHRKARASRSWERVNQALENDEIIKGFIKCRTKGGMIVDVFGIEAFLPGSQIDVKPIRDYDIFVGKTMEFKVVKINPEFKNALSATRHSSKPNSSSRSAKSSPSLKKARCSKVLSRTSPPMVCSSTSAALTALSTSPTFRGAA